MAEEGDEERELVPLEGAEDGDGSFFLGIICSQLIAFGNLDASGVKTRPIIKLNITHFCLQEHCMINAAKMEYFYLFLPFNLEQKMCNWAIKKRKKANMGSYTLLCDS